MTCRVCIPLRCLLAGLVLADLAGAAQITVKPPPKQAGVLEGYPPESEEPNPGQPKRRVVIEEEGPPPVTVPRGCYYVRMEDLARAAADTRNPHLKAVLQNYLVAFDRLIYSDNNVKQVCPVPLYREAKFPPRFGVFPLGAAGEPGALEAVDAASVRRVEYFEELLDREAARLLNPPKVGRTSADDADLAEKALVAEQLRAAAVQFHETARDLSKRRGSGWDRVRGELIANLKQTRLRRLTLAVERKDWSTVRSLGSRMANLYADDLKLLEDVYAARLAEALIAAQTDSITEIDRAREMLSDFESRFPASTNPTATAVRAALESQKEKLFRRAELAVRTGNREAAQLLRSLEAIDPAYPGLAELMAQIKGLQTRLIVGVNRLPERMSPVAARSDADWMAVELIFENLVDAIPDDVQGTRYRPGLALGMPAVLSGARDVRLPRPVPWAGLPQQFADAADVAGTLRLLQHDFRHTWAAANIAWFAEQPRILDQNALRIHFHRAHPHPLSLLHFKVLPVRWLAGRGLSAADPAFALHPYGTGPFMARRGPDGKVNSFLANPAYGRRPHRTGQPFIHEIRFLDAAQQTNLPGLFRTGQLHLLVDVPTQDLGKYRGAESGLIGHVEVVTPGHNRRIWALAVNHRRPALQSVSLRRGLSHAIDREAILNNVFRAGLSEYHRALNGPYPPECWATPRLPARPQPLHNRDLAAAKFTEHLRSEGSSILRLVVPAADPRVVIAADIMKKQIESLASTPDGKITIQVTALPPDTFENTVYREFNFDLAYVPLDYPDDWFPFGLAAMLDPDAALPEGRNVGGYLSRQSRPGREDEALAQRLIEVQRHTDFAGSILPITHDLHRRFNEVTPFIPLWQLDRHLVISTRVKISFDDDGSAAPAKLLPYAIFTQIGRWKLD